MGAFSDLYEVFKNRYKPEIQRIDGLDFDKPVVKSIEVNRVPPAGVIDIGDFAILRIPEIGKPQFQFPKTGIFICAENRDDMVDLSNEIENLVELEYWRYIFETIIKKPEQVDSEVRKSLYLLNKLYPYQIVGVNFLLNNDAALLGDQMGLGKTVTTTVALKLLIRRGIRKRALIVCPVSVLYVWEKHLREWSPELVYVVVRGDQRTRRELWKTPAHVYLTSYPTLRIDVLSKILSEKRRRMFDLVILDEAHSIKNFDAKQSKAVKTLQAGQRWALTGTPVMNRESDMIAIFDFLKPGYLKPEDQNRVNLREKIKPFFLRRRKDVELKDQLPERNDTQEVWMDLDEDQRREYDQVLAQTQVDFSCQGEEVSYVSIFAALNTLKQICNCATGKTISPKTIRLYEQVEEIVANGDKVVVFSQYIQRGIKLFEPVLRPFGVCTLVGGMSDAERRAAIECFQRKDTNVMLVSLRAGGEGLTLTEANYVIHADFWWNMASVWQAEERVYRIGQKKNVSVYAYWMRETVEEKIYAILQEKGLLFREVVEELAGKNATKLISKREWLKIFGVR